MGIVGRFLKVQWRLTLDWPDFGFPGHVACATEGPQRQPQELGFDDWVEVLDDVTLMARQLPQPGRMHFYVGARDTAPEHLFPLLERMRERDLEIRLLGRPSFLDEPTVAQLQRLGVELFNIRFLPREHHEAEADARELEAAAHAIALLRRAGIPFRFRFVVDKSNLQDFDRVLRFVEQHEIPSFDLMRGVPARTPDGGREPALSAAEFRELLVRTRRAFSQWKQQDRPMRLAPQRAEHLWWLFDWEAGQLQDRTFRRHAVHSCSVGRNLLAIRPDGTVWPCRRLPLPIGRLPQQTAAEIFDSPELAALQRDRPSCAGCPVLHLCGGCLALAYGTSRDPFAPDPQCWWPGADATTDP